MTTLLHKKLSNEYFDFLVKMVELGDNDKHAHGKLLIGAVHHHVQSLGVSGRIKDLATLESNKHRDKGEHIIPINVIKNALYDGKIELAKSLFEYSFVADISKESNSKLSGSLVKYMPEEFYDKTSELYLNPYARYLKVGIDLYLDDKKLDLSAYKNSIKGLE